MTEEDQYKEIAKMMREKSELRRKLVCLKNQLDEYKRALEQAHTAMSLNLFREADEQLFFESSGEFILIPKILGTMACEKQRELPSDLGKVADAQQEYFETKSRLDELTELLNAI